MIKSAYISDDGQYRYFLARTWNDDLPCVLFIMLNPSTADAEKDDPTIRRCRRYAESWGYGGFYVINLFAFRSPDPTSLLSAEKPIGRDNEHWFRKASKMASMVVCAWGNSSIVTRIQKRLKYDYLPLGWLDHTKQLYYLELSIDGTPKHPLYLIKDLVPKPYTLPTKLK